jgi:transposase InsO family protein
MDESCSEGPPRALHNFGSFTEARVAITKWIEWYNAGRPHQSLGYRSPHQFRELQSQLVA